MSNNPNRAAYYGLELWGEEWGDEYTYTPKTFAEVMALEGQISLLIKQKLALINEAGDIPGPLAKGKICVIDQQISYRTSAQQRWYR
jgi:hypothetical protein